MFQKAQDQNTSMQPSRLYYSMARNQEEIAEAQRLRYKVFAEEMGVDIKGHHGLDIDGFDQYCEHLLVRESETNRVIGTYRILTPKRADDAGGYYSASEFDLGRIAHLFDRTVEVGRACVHQDFRNGGTITMLWAGLAKFMLTHQYEYMIGCGSVPMNDGGHIAASLYNEIKDKYLCPPEYRVFPHHRLPLESLDQHVKTICPPLIKGYLRLGAYICGEPAWDPHFNTADMLVMLPLARLNRRYAEHFLK